MRPFDPRLLPHLGPAAPALTGVVAAGTGSSLAAIGQMFALAHLLVVTVSGRSQALPTAIGWVVATFALRALCGFASDACAARASAQVSASLRHRLLTERLRRPADELDGVRDGELTLLLTHGITAIDPYLTRYLPAFLLAMLLPPLTLVAIGTQDLLSAVIVLVTLPLMPVFAALIGLATRDRAARQVRLLAALAGHFVDVMRGLPTLVVHGRAKAQSERIRKVTDDYRRASLATLRIAFASSAALELIATLSVALVAVVVGLRLAAGSMEFGTALVVLLLAPEAYWPIRRVGVEYHAAAEGAATFAAATDLLDTEPDEQRASELPVSETWPGVVVEGLEVVYPGRRRAALRLPRADLPARSLVAVVGPSGSGKSTLLDVLAAERRPTQGRLSCGGLLVQPQVRAAWQQRVARMSQRPWVSDATVRENLLVARPDASEPELWEALRRAGLHETVSELADGLDHRLGEDGRQLSAGQRARLALARVVLADRPLVLVDEPSAHLDPETRLLVDQTLVWLAERSTVVVVTHAHDLVHLADAVIELDAPDTDTDTDAGTSAPQPEPAPVRPREVAHGEETDAVTGLSRRRTAAWLALGVLAAAAGVALTVTSGWLIARAAEHPPVLYLSIAIVAVRTFGIARPLLRYVERLVGHDEALRLLARRRVEVYDAVVPLTPGALGRRRGDVLASVVDDVDALLDHRLRVQGPILTAAVVSLTALLLTAVVLPAGALPVLALLALTVLAALLARAAAERLDRVTVADRARLSTRVLEVLQSGRELVLWQADGAAMDDLDRIALRLHTATRRTAVRGAAARALVIAATGVSTAALAWVAAGAVGATDLRGPVAAGLLLLPLTLLDVTLPAVDAAALSARTRAAKGRLTSLAGLPPRVQEPRAASEVRVGSAAGATRLRARGLAGGWDAPVFSGLDLEVGPGDRLGVRGPSGSGKSTLAALLVRFLDPTAGTVSVSGAPLPTLPLDDVRRTVGLVEDDPHVFSTSVVENVRLARPGATREEVREALHAAALGDWVTDLPYGLDTMIGEGFDAVSGGERARLALSRAVLADAAVLVLDEPTAHLDTETAQAVAADVLRATEGRAVVWITHDDVALEAMDEVIDLGCREARL